VTLLAHDKPALAGDHRRAASPDWLVRAAVFFAAAVIVHNSDHLRRGVDAAGRDVFWLGTAAIALEVAVVVLICQHHRLAPLVAAIAGFQFTVGYLAVHFAPAHPWFSDSFTSASSVSPLSWLAASLEVVAAAALGLAGLVALRRHSNGHGVVAPLTLRQAIAHPLALGFTLSQVAIVVISFVQLSRT
jgi:hypothetical protein